MHGEDEYSCEEYFCGDHKIVVELPTGECVALCFKCYEKLPDKYK